MSSPLPEVGNIPGTAAILQYAECFALRDAAHDYPARYSFDNPAVFGTASADPGTTNGRLLIIDDTALPDLLATLPSLSPRNVSVLATAPRAMQLIESSPDFGPAEVSTAMVRPDLDDIPALTLEPGLSARLVGESELSLTDAVCWWARLEQEAERDVPRTVQAREIRRFLAGLSHGAVFAAVDPAGRICATSASGVYGDHAQIVFVNTAHSHRRRGVGATMTTIAMTAARSSGARRASLTSSPAGLSVYQRLGFRSIGEIRGYFRTT